jgi:hypothetical protein
MLYSTISTNIVRDCSTWPGTGITESYGYANQITYNVLVNDNTNINPTSTVSMDIIQGNTGYSTGLGANVASASYIVYTDGTNFYMRNGTTGLIDYSSTNASTVLAFALGNSSSGSELYVRNGLYSLSGTSYGLLINKPITLAGEGNGTEFYTTSAINLILVNSSNANSASLENFFVSGWGSNSPIAGISLNATSDINLYNLLIQQFNAGVGLQINSSTVSNYYGLTFSNNLIGVQTNGAGGRNAFYGGNIYSNVASSKLIDIEGMDTLQTFGVDLEGSLTQTTGIYDNYGTSSFLCSGDRFENLLNGIVWNAGSNDKISECTFSSVTTNVTNPPSSTNFDQNSGLISCYAESWSGSSPVSVPNPLDSSLASSVGNLSIIVTINAAQPYQHSETVSAASATIYGSWAGSVSGWITFKWGY